MIGHACNRFDISTRSAPSESRQAHGVCWGDTEPINSRKTKTAKIAKKKRSYRKHQSAWDTHLISKGWALRRACHTERERERECVCVGGVELSEATVEL